MKVIVFLAVLGFAFAVPHYGSERDVEVRGIIEDGINKTLNEILANLTETINLDTINLDLENNDVLRGALNASSITIQGIKSLVATEISLNIFSLALDLKLHLTEVLVNFKYWADLTLLDFVPLYGNGRMNIVLEEIDISVSGKADLSDGISLSNITVGLGLGDATFDLNGLINNPEFSALVSTALNDNFVTFVNENAEVISSIISPIIESVIDSILHPSDDDPDTQKLEQLGNQYRNY